MQPCTGLSVPVLRAHSLQTAELGIKELHLNPAEIWLALAFASCFISTFLISCILCGLLSIMQITPPWALVHTQQLRICNASQ